MLALPSTIARIAFVSVRCAGQAIISARGHRRSNRVREESAESEKLDLT
jgi:hypothetical protein